MHCTYAGIVNLHPIVAERVDMPTRWAFRSRASGNEMRHMASVCDSTFPAALLVGLNTIVHRATLWATFLQSVI